MDNTYTQYLETIASTAINEKENLGEKSPELVQNNSSSKSDKNNSSQALNFVSTEYELPKPIDTCHFCKRTFLYPGSLGRHLDRKRGTTNHPSDEIDSLRKNVRRVGDVETAKLRARERQKRYRAKEHVKLKLREQRKKRYISTKSDNASSQDAINFEIPYPYLIMENLEPEKWPDMLPTESTFQQLVEKMPSEEDVSKLAVIHEEWMNLSNLEQLQIYLKCAQTILKKTPNASV